MGEDDGGEGGVEDVLHGGRGHVGDVGKHAQAVHLKNYGLAELGEAVVPHGLGAALGLGGVGPV